MFKRLYKQIKEITMKLILYSTNYDTDENIFDVCIVYNDVEYILPIPIPKTANWMIDMKRLTTVVVHDIMNINNPSTVFKYKILNKFGRTKYGKKVKIL